jgi:hypothetical protein
MTDAVNFTLAKELDRFDVPPLSTGLADRIVAATMTSISAPSGAPRHDRRGMWRRGRQVLLGTLAVGLLSAGAVASGFLGRVGIEVPVLTAMLAPKPKPVTKRLHVAPKPPETRTATVVLPALIAEPTPVGADRPLPPAERLAMRKERRERRLEFAAKHTGAATMIGARVHVRLQRRALLRRKALMTPGIDNALAGLPSTDFADRAALARAARHDRAVSERMIDRRILARQAQGSKKQIAADASGPSTLSTPSTVSRAPPRRGEVDPIALAHEDGFSQRMLQATPEQRAARRAHFQQMSSGQRAEFRDRMQERGAMRFGRNRHNPRRK